MRTNIALAAALSSALASQAAAIDTIGVLAVSEPPGPSPELADLTRQLRDVMIAQKTAGVLTASQLQERMTGQSSTSSLSELDRAYVQALAFFQAGEYEAAIRALRAIIQELDTRPGSPEAFDQWSRAMLRLGRAEQIMQRDAEAQAVIERLVRANPQVRVDPAQYPPSYLKVVEEVRTQQKALKTLKLSVNGDKGVRVFVEGRDVGPAPVTVNLPPGRYRVSGAHDGVRVPGLTVNLAAQDVSVTLDLALARALRAGAGPGLALPAADRLGRITTAAASLGLHRVVVATLAQEGDVAFLVGTHYDVRSGGKAEREARLRLASNKTPPRGGLEALAKFLMLGEPSPFVEKIDHLTPTPPLPSPMPPMPPRGEGKSRVLGWSAIGAGGLAVALGGFAIYSSKKSSGYYGDAKAMRDPDGGLRPPNTAAQYNALIADGDHAKTLAVGTGIGAGVALGTSAVLGYLSYRQTGEIGPFRF